MKSFVKFLLFYLVKIAFWFRYKITIKGLEHIDPKKMPKSGGTLILFSHPTVFIDPALVATSVFKKFDARPVIVEHHYYKPLVQRAMQFLDALPIPSFYNSSNSWKRRKGDLALKTISDALKKGDSFLIAPAGKVKGTAFEEIGANSAVHKILEQTPEANVILVRTKGLWGSSFSRALSGGGESPPMFATIWHGVKACLKNLLFFTPRREVILEFYPEPQDFPREAPRSELNSYLERWYNQPDGLSDQKGDFVGDSLILVPYSRWSDELPTIQPPKATQEEKINLSIIPDALKKKVTTEIARIAERHPEEIKPSTSLAHDLSLDSLDTAEIAAFLHQEFDCSTVPVFELTTVGKVMAIAAKQVTFEGEIAPEHELNLKRWNQKTPKKRIHIAKGTTIPEVFLNNCSRMGNAIACADLRSGVLTYKQLKMRVVLLAEYIRTLPGDYVGIMLPASVGAYILVLATQLAGKVPLMVNWTLGSRHLQSVAKLSNVQTVLTSWAFVDRLENIDFDGIEDKMVMLEDVRSTFGLFTKIKALLLSKLGTHPLLRHFGTDDLKKDDFGVLLFTSGTESMPKGVPLTHENLLSNQRAALDMAEVYSDDVDFGILPPFHAFGFTYSGILPLLAGMKIAFSPDPTNGKQLAKDFERFGITIMCSAPTFVKNMLKNAEPKQLKTLRLCLTGAEKTPPDLVKQMDEMGLKAYLYEGYGITECSPVLTLNPPGLPNIGVGRAVPGVELKVIHPETHEPLPTGQQGLIIAKGPNIFSGYLNPGLSSPFITFQGDKWYQTGDLGFLNETGHLTLSGRKKRFIKIGGEMVSLAAIEDAILHTATAKKWEIDEEEGPAVAICARENNGEKPRIYLFTKFATTTDEVNKSLNQSGFSNLVKISDVTQLKTIPIMGSGKINYRALEEEYLA